MLVVVVLPLMPVYGGQDVLRPDPALHGPVLVHVHLGALHLVDQAPQAPNQQVAALLLCVCTYTQQVMSGRPTSNKTTEALKNGYCIYPQNVDREGGGGRTPAEHERTLFNRPYIAIVDPPPYEAGAEITGGFIRITLAKHHKRKTP